MGVLKPDIRALTEKLFRSRLRLLTTNGFYGLLLMHMRFALDDSFETAATDGKRILFSPAFLEGLNERELDFVLMHEILHVVLEHCFRGGDRDHDLFNIACDIVVNSNILLSNGGDIDSITVRSIGGEAMHLTPDGKEGAYYTAEEVYAMLLRQPGAANRSSKGGGNGAGSQGSGSGGGSDGDEEDQKAGGGKGSRRSGGDPAAGGAGGGGGTWDDHSRWGDAEEDEILHDEWVKRLEDTCEVISQRDAFGGRGRGTIPVGAERLLKELREPQLDWREILNDFVQEEVTDYSFSPPDRRFDDSPFFLPDYNEKEEFPEDILFMIDTSGSMSDDEITQAYSEIKGAIDQFGGKLKGWLGFCDAAVVEPQPFSDMEEFRVIRPKGGGGTSFTVIFSYVEEQMQDKLPASIIILTDGYAPFPAETRALGIPVLWLITNEEVTPPWGRVARIRV